MATSREEGYCGGSVVAGEFLLFLVVGDGDCTCADAAAGGAAVAVLGTEYHWRSDAAGADAGADTECIVFGSVLKLTGGEGGGGEGVFVVSDGAVAGGDNPAFEVGVAFDFDLEATIPGLEAALRLDTGVISFNVAQAGVEAGAGFRAYSTADAETFLFAAVGAGVLQGFDVEVAADVGNDLFADSCGTFEVGIASRLDVERISCCKVGVGIANIFAIDVTACGSGVGSVTELAVATIAGG